MGAFADELRAGMGEAARKMTGARLAGDDYGAEAYRERLRCLRRIARGGVEVLPSSQDCGDCGAAAAALVPGGART